MWKFSLNTPFCKHEHEGHKLPVVVRLYGPLHPTMHFTVSGHASATEGRDSVVVLSTGLGVAISAKIKKKSYMRTVRKRPFPKGT